MEVIGALGNHSKGIGGAECSLLGGERSGVGVEVGRRGRSEVLLGHRNRLGRLEQEVGPGWGQQVTLENGWRHFLVEEMGGGGRLGCKKKGVLLGWTVALRGEGPGGKGKRWGGVGSERGECVGGWGGGERGWGGGVEFNSGGCRVAGVGTVGGGGKKGGNKFTSP